MSQAYIISIPEMKQEQSSIIIDFIILTILWSVFANFSIFFVMYRNRPYCYYVHMYISWTIVIFTMSMALWVLMQRGILIGPNFQMLQSIHNAFGILVLALILVQSYSGSLSKTFQQSPEIKTINVMRAKKLHKYIGYSLFFIAKFLITTGWYGLGYMVIFYVLLCWEIIWIILLIIRKLFYINRLQMNVVSRQMEENFKGTIINDISQFPQKIPFVVFENNVYDITPLYTNHPGGVQIVSSLFGREVCRFMYGMYSNEKAIDIPPHSHSQKSISILGDPIARLNIASIYQGMDRMNRYVVGYNNNYDDSFFILGLIPGQNSVLNFIPYQNLKQFGQYHAVNLSSAPVTRLYTTVSCLRRKNLATIAKIAFSLQRNLKKFLSQTTIRNVQSNTVINTSNTKIEMTFQQPVSINQEVNQIPIMFKRYQQGKLTPILSEVLSNQQINISSQRGIGMRLHVVEKGNVIFVAGGTGLCPYMDLIDMLFKHIYNLSQNHENISFMINSNLSASSFFNRVRIIFLIAVQKLEDIHPLTLFQLKYLVQHNKKFKCVLKIKNVSRGQLPGFQFVEGNFQPLIKNMISDQDFTKMYICGPTNMSKSLLQLLQSEKVNSNKYMIL